MARGSWVATAVRISIFVLLVSVACCLATVFFPRTDVVSNADVIYVLGPPSEARLELAREMRQDGISPRILVSVLETGVLSASELPICREMNVDCMHPTPASTLGELTLLEDYLSRNGLSSAAVVTFTPHVERARFIFTTCSSIGASFVAADDELTLGDWLYQMAYQTGAFLKALGRGCG